MEFSFGLDIGERLHLIESQEEADDVTRKFLCTQLPNWRLHYPFVASDLSSIDYRRPGVMDNYAQFKDISPELLERLVSHPDNAALVPAGFLEQVNPPAGKEMYAFFVMGQRHKANYKDHLERLGADAAMRKRIEKYDAANEAIGKMVAQMRVGSTNFVCECLDPPEVQTSDTTNNRESFLTDADTYDASVEVIDEPIDRPSERELWENPVLKAFKADAQLSTSYSNHNAINQYLASRFAPHICAQLPKARHQTEIPLGKPDDGWERLLDALEPGKLREVTQTRQAQQYYRNVKDKPTTNRQWVAGLLGAQMELEDDVTSVLFGQ